MLSYPNLAAIDVRSGESWEKSNLKIKGAVREDPGKCQLLDEKIPEGKDLRFLLTLTQRGDQCPCGTTVHGTRVPECLCPQRRLERMGKCWFSYRT